MAPSHLGRTIQALKETDPEAVLSYLMVSLESDKDQRLIQKKEAATSA